MVLHYSTASGVLKYFHKSKNTSIQQEKKISYPWNSKWIPGRFIARKTFGFYLRSLPTIFMITEHTITTTTSTGLNRKYFHRAEVELKEILKGSAHNLSPLWAQIHGIKYGIITKWAHNSLQLLKWRQIQYPGQIFFFKQIFKLTRSLISLWLMSLVETPKPLDPLEMPYRHRIKSWVLFNIREQPGLSFFSAR